MSGGAFDYLQYKIECAREDIQAYLDNQGKTIVNEHYEVYSPEVQQAFRDAIKALSIAEVYLQRVDYFLAGDDGEENFLRRLYDELSELKQKS